MFAKLLKYDNRAILKYWWIAALTSFGFALFGGVCIRIADVEYTNYALLQNLAVLGIVLSVLGLFVLPVLTEILVIVRFYKHFFTDEGYLTFTLPVKRSSLLNAKLTMAMLFSVVSVLTVLADVWLMLAIGLSADDFQFMWSSIHAVLADFYGTTGWYGGLYTLLGILILLASMLTSMLSVFLCITFANMITKRFKVLVAIGFYYGANAAVSMGMQILTFGGLFTIVERISELSQGSLYICITFILLCLLGVLVTVAAGLYLLVLYMLDKRLNLD